MSKYSDFLYPRGMTYFDSDRRERLGNISQWLIEDEVNGTDFRYINTFAHYDFTNYYDENHTLDFTFAELANGVRLVGKCYYTKYPATGTPTRKDLVIELHYYDDDDNDITRYVNREYHDDEDIEYTYLATFAGDDLLDETDISFSVNCFTTLYDNDERNPYIRPVSVYMLKENAVDPPALRGFVSSTTLSAFYNSGFIGNIYGTDSYDKFFNALKEKGDGTPISPILPSEDTSDDGGGDDADPDYNPFTEDIDFPLLPSTNALSSGLISAYSPTNHQLQLLAEKLWSDNFIEELVKIWNDPMEGVVSLHMIPFSAPVSGSSNCMIGNYDTDITMATVPQQFIYRSGGSITVRERFGSALDYSPYTTVHIHIPFVGIVPLDIDYIMNKTLILRYQIDILTGSAVAMLSCDNAVLYSFPCNVAMTIPLTSSNHQALYRDIINVASNLGNTIVSGAGGGNAKAVGHGVVSTLESALDTVASKHSEVQKSGNITGSLGVLDTFDTYLIFHRPKQSLAENFAHFKGFPSNITSRLGSLTGYTEVEYAHLEGVTATDEEKNEIQTLLQTGVIL